jgi:hypothetical protein
MGMAVGASLRIRETVDCETLVALATSRKVGTPVATFVDAAGVVPSGLG